MLVSELRERFFCDLRDSVRYGDLLYVPHIDNLLINNFKGDAKENENTPSARRPILFVPFIFI